MCGRFALTASPEAIQAAFPGYEVPRQLAPRYNIAPTQPVAVISNTGSQAVDVFVWGLIPSWAQDPSIGNRMINARAESLAEKPAYRNAYRRRRCLVLTDGFYEWRKEPGQKAKTPMYIHLKSGGVFAFAGLWEVWNSPLGDPVYSCTVITTGPNTLMQPIHDRMPVILAPADYDRWLAPEERRPEQLADLLKPYPVEDMEAFAVSPLVNSPVNDSAQCIEPA